MDSATAMVIIQEGATHLTRTPAEYRAAEQFLAATPAGDSFLMDFVPSDRYAQLYAEAHPGVPAGSNTWLWIGAAIGVWWFFFRRR